MEKRADKLIKIYGEKIRKFRENHITSIFCERLKSNPKMNIYLCHAKCRAGFEDEEGKTWSGCRYFEREVYLCKDLGCDRWLQCAFLSDKKRARVCKKFNLLNDKKELREKYKKFFLLNKVYRGLKLDPEKTLRWLDKRKNNGKVSTSQDKKKASNVRRRKVSKNKRKLKRKKAS